MHLRLLSYFAKTVHSLNPVICYSNIARTRNRTFVSLLTQLFIELRLGNSCNPAILSHTTRKPGSAPYMSPFCDFVLGLWPVRTGNKYTVYYAIN